jgi:hypothetical protein
VRARTQKASPPRSGGNLPSVSGKMRRCAVGYPWSWVPVFAGMTKTANRGRVSAYGIKGHSLQARDHGVSPSILLWSPPIARRLQCRISPAGLARSACRRPLFRLSGNRISTRKRAQQYCEINRVSANRVKLRPIEVDFGYLYRCDRVTLHWQGGELRSRKLRRRWRFRCCGHVECARARRCRARWR